MEEVKVTRNYQITIPYEVRKKLNINVGDKLIVYIEGDKIVIKKKKGDIASLGLSLGKKFTDKYVNEVIREAGERIGSSS